MSHRSILLHNGDVETKKQYELGGSERALPCRRLHPAFPLVERRLRYAFVLTKLSDGHLRLLEPFQTLGPKQSDFG